jgi:urea transport system ATP-binding protein
MLTVSELNQFYGESHTLRDMELTVPEGSCTCLMGRNGVGKTTLLQCIMGLLPARSGRIEFAGEDLLKYPPEQRAYLGIGYVPQGRQIFPLLNVEENLRIGLPARHNRRRQIPELVFELFPALKDMLKRRGGDLSGGQQQQVAIARALVIDPKFLILDEPTEGIQPNIVHEIGDVIMQLNRQPQSNVVQEILDAIQRLNRQEGMTVLLVEQKLPFARRVAREFCVMERGRAVVAGTMTDLNEALVKKHLSV